MVYQLSKVPWNTIHLFISFQVYLLELRVKVAFFEFKDFMWLVETNDTWITIEPQEIDNTMSKVQQLVESLRKSK
jgi:hypothetical protein